MVVVADTHKCTVEMMVNQVQAKQGNLEMMEAYIKGVVDTKVARVVFDHLAEDITILVVKAALGVELQDIKFQDLLGGISSPEVHRRLVRLEDTRKLFLVLD